MTHTGLPRRMPQANLVPGAAVDAVPGLVPGLPMGLSRDPKDVRSRLDSFVHGIEQGRAGAEAPLPAVPPNPMTAPSPLPTAPVGNPVVNKPAPAAAGESRKPAKDAAKSIPAARRPAGERPAKPVRKGAAKPPAKSAPEAADEQWGDGWKTFRPGG
ncbi:hypothetical protein [Yinghuangia soli]|uniref:Uncharacterized protein n=1 Tax=Yinghuangia soli TaxID=2908204 RepID=A0AA41U413_9ACTN|nr:hypothetical protein [Yinghuangia soli]MCF2528599.1 hypothetical protein [Yinghuangia soli]